MKKILTIAVILILSIPAFAEDNEMINTITDDIESCKYENCSNTELYRLYRHRAYVYETEVSNEDKAFADYVKASKYNPKDTYTLFKIAKFKSKFGDNEGAIEEVKKMIQLEPNNPEHHYFAALLYGVLKQDESAIKEYTEAIKLKPKYPEAFRGRGLSELALGKKEKGFQDLGYAKQQFYEANMIEEYKSVVNIINRLK